MSPGSEPLHPPSDEWLFRCDVVRRGETANLRAIGELDMHAVPAISAKLAQLREAGCPHVIIDLSELSFLDSSGLRFILDCYAEASQDGCTIALIPGPRAVQRVFELTGTIEHLPFIGS